MTMWFRSYWDEEDIWFYFEVGDDGWVSRQAELQGPELRPLADAQDTDSDSRYGITAESPLSEWEGHVAEQLTAEQFESVWAAARRQLSAHPASCPAGSSWARNAWHGTSPRCRSRPRTSGPSTTTPILRLAMYRTSRPGLILEDPPDRT
ncbi:hypothetical protein [Streptomyces sp. NBC_00872]|uniref:hypothetical protein n=1 Tax=Streptomyces sp. NBC_00872 TaxID=2903686 RepID=UPI00386ECF82